MFCASSQARSHAGVGDGPSSSPFWPRGGFDATGPCGRWWTLGPLAFVGMILGFILFWPIGLAILFYNLWTRKGGAMPFANLMDRAPFTAASSGNMAFDDWRRAEIERIENERRKLAEAEKEFAAFVDELKRAKDREEFERFMNARRTWTDKPQDNA